MVPIAGMSRTQMWLIITAAAVALTPIFWFWWVATDFYRQKLPPILETAGPVRWSSNFKPIELILPLPPSGCGAAIFHLRPETARRIAQDGLSFFDGAPEDALEPRGARGGPRYSAWRETPAPANWFGDGRLSTLFACASFGETFTRDIVAEAKSPGSYFTSRGNTELLVLPAQNMVVFTYFD